MEASERTHSAAVAASACVDEAVEIRLRLNRQSSEVVSIDFGRHEELTIDFCDVESLERLAAVATDGARQLRERTAADT